MIELLRVTQINIDSLELAKYCLRYKVKLNITEI